MRRMKNKVQYYSKEFYPIAIIRKAIHAYSKLAVVDVSEEKEHYKCIFSDCVIDSERIVCEFDNYLIELLNSTEMRVDS